MNLKGKRALVTGGAVRIGRAIIETLIQHLTKAGWKPAVRIAGFQPALS